MYKFILLFISFIIFVEANFEIDIDKINSTSYGILINDKYYGCTPKSPPLSHGWAYECSGSQNRRLRGNFQK